MQKTGIEWENLPLSLKLDQVAEVLGISRKVAYDLARQPGFPVVRIGEKRLIVPRELLRNWLQKNAGAI